MRRMLFHPDTPFAPRRWPFAYGWVVMVVGTLGVLASIPGQTVSIGPFIDYLIPATGLSRTELANAYLFGTLSSGLMMPAVGGRLVDSLGSRRVAMVAGCIMAVVMLLLTRCDSLPGRWVRWSALLIGFLLLRFNGQGLMVLASRTMLARWFDRWRGRVNGYTGPVVAYAFSATPYLLIHLIRAIGWRQAWGLLALVCLAAIVPMAWVFFRDHPEECGLHVDAGRAPAATGEGEDPVEELAIGVEEARRTVSFWVVCAVLALHALTLTGVTFHLTALGEESGVGAEPAVSLFLYQAVVACVVGIGVGHLADRCHPRIPVLVMCTGQAIGFAACAHLGSTWSYLTAVLGLGLTSGCFGVILGTAMPRLFGRRHLGRIGGLQMAVIVVGSSLGPTVLSVVRDVSGLFAYALVAAAVLAVPIAIAALAIRQPPRCAV